MSKAKRKKAEKGYSYYEYLKKFRPESLPKEEQPTSKGSLHCLSGLVLDKIAPEGVETPAQLEKRN
jgi:hypothetical protein